MGIILIMNKFAVIETGGKQYKISEGEFIDVELLKDSKEGDKVSFDKVIVLDDGSKTELGNPYLKGVKVDGEVLKVFKGTKISVIKFKSKSNYKRHTGHRQTYTRVKVNSIK